MALRGEHHSRARRKRLHSRLGNAAVGYSHAPRSAYFSVSRLSAKKKQVVSKEKVVPLKVMYRILSSKRNDIDILMRRHKGLALQVSRRAPYNSL